MIFLNYRREDTAGHAGRLFDRLAARFGRDQVFMDVDTIQPGEDFAEAIVQRIASSRALVVLIGDQWLSLKGRDERQRLEDPADFVRLEIIAALERRVQVIPVLVEGARMPRAEELPEALRPLLRLQAMEISDTRFDDEAQILIRVLESQDQAVVRRRGSVRLRRRLVIAGALIALAAPLAILLRPRHDDPQELAGRWQAAVPDDPGRPARTPKQRVRPRWLRRAETQDPPAGRTFPVVLELRVSAGQLLGTVTYPTGVGSIEEGRIEGRRVTFVTRHVPQFESQPATTRFAGEWSGEDLSLTMQSDTRVREFVAHRVP